MRNDEFTVLTIHPSEAMIGFGQAREFSVSVRKLWLDWRIDHNRTLAVVIGRSTTIRSCGECENQRKKADAGSEMNSDASANPCSNLHFDPPILCS